MKPIKHDHLIPIIVSSNVHDDCYSKYYYYHYYLMYLLLYFALLY